MRATTSSQNQTRRKNPAEMVALYRKSWLKKYPEIWSIEDGVAEDDQAGWKQMTKELGNEIQLVGDDNFVTNPALFRRGIRRESRMQF